MSNPRVRIAIQGEPGSNSHLAARALFPEAEMIACDRSAVLMVKLERGEVDAAVLPFENTLHGAVAEHYDLLLEHAAVRIAGESLLRIRHSVIGARSVKLGEIRRVLSHPVALSQCRRWLASHVEILPEPFYDTAGSVKWVVERDLRDTAGIAPSLAAEVYGGELLLEGIEDHARNFTRFHTLVRGQHPDAGGWESPSAGTVPDEINKLSLAFSLEHRPGTLVRALSALAGAGADLSRIESRPVHGRPWEYVFFVDMRCDGDGGADSALRALAPVCGFLRELGRYRAALPVEL